MKALSVRYSSWLDTLGHHSLSSLEKLLEHRLGLRPPCCLPTVMAIIAYLQ